MPRMQEVEKFEKLQLSVGDSGSCFIRLHDFRDVNLKRGPDGSAVGLIFSRAISDQYVICKVKPMRSQFGSGGAFHRRLRILE